jgi:hypothetical protein
VVLTGGRNSGVLATLRAVADESGSEEGGIVDLRSQNGSRAPEGRQRGPVIYPAQLRSVGQVRILDSVLAHEHSWSCSGWIRRVSVRELPQVPRGRVGQYIHWKSRGWYASHTSKALRGASAQSFKDNTQTRKTGDRQSITDSEGLCHSRR